MVIVCKDGHTKCHAAIPDFTLGRMVIVCKDGETKCHAAIPATLGRMVIACKDGDTKCHAATPDQRAMHGGQSRLEVTRDPGQLCHTNSVHDILVTDCRSTQTR